MELQPDRDSWSVLLDTMYIAADSRDPHDLADHVLQRLIARNAITAGGIWLRDEGAPHCLVQYGFERLPSLAQIHRVVEDATPAFVNGAEHTAGASGNPPADMLAFLPLSVAQERIGALVLATAPDTADRALYQAIAAHLALALYSTRAWRQRGNHGDRSIEYDWATFLAHAAHEIKNPLASIKGYADLLLRRAAREPADPNHKGLTIIAQQVVRTTNLLEQLSDVARVGADRLPLDRHETDLAALVRQVVETCWSATHRHQIRVDGADEPVRVSCDAERVGQVITAMLDNAIKFSPEGGPIAVRLHRSDDLPSSAEHGDAEAIISVSDRGIGVPAGEQERVFERFFRGSNVVGSYRGLGVSLYVGRAIMERHGGRLWLLSRPGEGTTCYAALPLPHHSQPPTLRG